MKVFSFAVSSVLFLFLLPGVCFGQSKTEQLLTPEQIIFPEVDIDKVNRITGLDITFVTTANSDEEAYELLKELGMPFRDIKK